MKQFIVSDERVNSYGFRVLTAGIGTEDFAGNPIGLWNHTRAWRGLTDEVLPIARWKDLKKGKDGTMTAYPEFDQNDEFAKKIQSKVEGGFLNAASIGIVIVEISDDPALMLPGQKYGTVTKSRLKEISIADIPSNAGALALYDAEGNLINLSDDNMLSLTFGKPQNGDQEDLTNFTHLNTISTMLKEINAHLGLSATADENVALQALRIKMERLTVTEAELAQLKEADKARRSAEVSALLSDATADGRITAADQDRWKKLFDLDFDTTKGALTAVPGVVKLSDFATGDKPETGAKAKFSYNGKSFSELSKEAPQTLQLLRENEFETFKQLYKAEYGKEYRT